MSARVIVMVLCAAALLGCAERESQGRSEERPEAPTSRPQPPHPAATAPAGRPGSKIPASAPLTREIIYAEAVQVFARISAAKSAHRRNRLLAEAAKRVPTWYLALDVPPPDTSSPGWLTTVLWDTMPEQEYQKAVEKSRGLFQEYGKPFPDNVGRREFQKALEELPKETTDSHDHARKPRASSGPGRLRSELGRK